MTKYTDSALEIGPYQLDSGPYRLWRGSKEIALRPKSLKVLAYLAHRPGRLVTKDELREHVWGVTPVSDTRIRVTVHEVRSALGSGQDGPDYLETVPGRGYRLVTRNKADTQSTPGPPLKGRPHPVVGRERELEYLVNRYREANLGERRLIFVGGEPGVGKTTLISLFLEHLAGRPNTVCASGQSVMHFGAGEAYAPILEALGRLGHEGFGNVLIRALERHAPMWLLQLPTLVGSELLEQLQHQVLGATQDRMVREFNDTLKQLTAKHTLVLVLEDLHWSDTATIDLLASVAQRPESARLIIIGTYRPAEATVSAPRFLTMMHELETHGLCEHIDLELLMPSAVASYVNARIDDENTEDVATAVYERSDGNALFMVNLFEHLLDAHAISRRADRWVVDRDSVALRQIPEGLRPFIEHRLETLSDENRELLEMASVVGIEFTAAVTCAGLPDSSQERCLERVEAQLNTLASRTQLIFPCGAMELPDGVLTARFRFGHALYRDGLYEQIPETRRVRLHRRVAEWVRMAWGEDTQQIAVALADHFERGRDYRNAAQYRRKAGEQALGRHAYHEAVLHYQAALEAFDQTRSQPAKGDPEDSVRCELEVCWALVTALSVTRGQSDPEIGKTHSRAASLLERLDDPMAKLPTLMGLWSFNSAAANLTECANLVSRMLELATGVENDEVELMSHCARARVKLFCGKLAESADSARRVFTLYDPLRHSDMVNRYGDDEAGVSALGADAWRLWLQGFPAQAAAQAHAACELAERLDDPFSRAYACVWSIGTLQLLGETVQLEQWISDLHRLSTEFGFSLWSAWATFFEGWETGVRTDEADGIAMMERGLDQWLGTGTHIGEPYLLALLAETCLRTGRVDAASERLAEARDRVEKTGECWWEAELHRLEGEILLAAGDGDHDERAEACFRRALEVAGRQGATSLELRAALSLSRLGRSPDAHQLLGEIVSRFTEGHDTADLRAAQTQLSQVQPPTDV